MPFKRVRSNKIEKTFSLDKQLFLQISVLFSQISWNFHKYIWGFFMDALLILFYNECEWMGYTIFFCCSSLILICKHVLKFTFFGFFLSLTGDQQERKEMSFRHSVRANKKEVWFILNWFTTNFPPQTDRWHCQFLIPHRDPGKLKKITSYIWKK